MKAANNSLVPSIVMQTGNNEGNNAVYWLTSWRVYAAAVSIYFLATLVTDAFFMGDTADYVGSIIAYEQGRNVHFWEFGHLLWRPFGWAMAEILRPVTSWFIGPLPQLNVLLTLIWINWAAGLLSVICLIYLLSRFCQNGLIISLTTVGFIFSQGILNYAQTGLSYVPGLAFLLLGLCFVVREAMSGKHAWINSLAAGLSFAVAVGFWFLYVLALPAAMLLPLIWHGINRHRIKFMIATGVTFSAITGLFYLIAIIVSGITSFTDLKDWILDAGHGMNIKGFARIVLGVVRTFINLGNDGMLMKRFLLEDPYNPVSFWQLALSSLWKVVFFYGFLVTILWMLCRAKNGFRGFLLLLATAPIFGFAYFFSPSDIERYMAWYPFFFLLVAYAIENNLTVTWANIVSGAFLIILVTTNSQAMFTSSLARQQELIASRLGDLPDKIPLGSVVIAVNWQDELVNFHRSFPFHPLNKSQTLQITSLVSPGMADAKYWRRNFAERALKVWSRGGEIWLSDRALSHYPAADWNWVEGDEKNVSWKQFPEFFAKIKLGSASGGSGGFHLILPSEQNQHFLQEVIELSNQSKEHFGRSGGE